jgi:hypothetical protein
VNAFLELAERQMSAPRKARERAAEKRAQTKAEKALADRDQLFQLWRKWHREQCDALLTGSYGEAGHELVAFLDTMSLEQAPNLIALVERGPWRSANPDARYHVLRLIDGHIAHLRERAGLAPFEDSLPFTGEAPTAFEVIRGMLAC